MEIQQHDGVVVEVAGIPAGLRQAQAGGRGVTGGRGRRQGLGCGCPPSPPLFIGVLGGAGHPEDLTLEIPSEGGGGQGGFPSPPRHLGGAFH